MVRFDQKHKRAERDAPAETTTAPAPTARLHLGELTSPLLPNAGVIPTSAFWESARPGVFISPTPAVRSGPDAWNHAIGTVTAMAPIACWGASPRRAS
jgi:hypothetical protein